MGPTPLAAYTTLGLGGPAATLTEPASEAGLVAAVRGADERGEPVLVLGGGSNVVIADEGFPGLVVRVATRGISIAPGEPAADASAFVPLRLRPAPPPPPPPPPLPYP